MHSIAKICSDHLRAFSNNYGVKLKSGHAHELVAAYFGYKSKAAMRADTLCSTEYLGQAQIFVRLPSLYFERRRQCLENLPPDLPDTDKLCEELSAFLQQMLSVKFFTSWQHLSEVYAKKYLQKHKDLILPLNFRLHENASDIFDKPLHEFNPKIEITDSGVKLIVANSYCGSHNLRFQGSIDVRIAIKLQRIAGYVGYTNAEISLIDSSSQSFGQSGAI